MVISICTSHLMILAGEKEPKGEFQNKEQEQVTNQPGELHDRTGDCSARHSWYVKDSTLVH